MVLIDRVEQMDQPVLVFPDPANTLKYHLPCITSDGIEPRCECGYIQPPSVREYSRGRVDSSLWCRKCLHKVGLGNDPKIGYPDNIEMERENA